MFLIYALKSYTDRWHIYVWAEDEIGCGLCASIMATVIGLTQHQQHWVIFSELRVPHNSLYDVEKIWLDSLKSYPHWWGPNLRERARAPQGFHPPKSPSQSPLVHTKQDSLHCNIGYSQTQFSFVFLSHSSSYTINVGDNKQTLWVPWGPLERQKIELRDNWKNPNTYHSEWKCLEERNLPLGDDHWSMEMSKENKQLYILTRSIFWNHVQHQFHIGFHLSSQHKLVNYLHANKQHDFCSPLSSNQYKKKSAMAYFNCLSQRKTQEILQSESITE